MARRRSKRWRDWTCCKLAGGRWPSGWRPLLLRVRAGAGAERGAGREVQLCSACHGEDGNSKIEKIPSLAGQPAFFILNQLFLMREGVRKVEAMAPIVKDLKDDDLTNAVGALCQVCRPSAAMSRRSGAGQARRRDRSTQRRCGSCHLPNLAGSEQMPRIAKQRIDYLIADAEIYRDSPRPGGDTAMSANHRRRDRRRHSRSRTTPRLCSAHSQVHVSSGNRTNAFLLSLRGVLK